MVEQGEQGEVDIPTQGEGWFEDLPEEVSNYKYPIYYRYTDDNETLTREEVAASSLKPNIGPLINEGYSLNIFIRNDLKIDEKRIAFLHELYESYYVHSLGMSKEEAHKKAKEKFSF
jgi:hypothetical protein